MIDKLSWMTIYPEVVLLIMACIIALVDLSATSPRRTGTYVLTLLTLAIVAVLTGFNAAEGKTIYGFGGMVVSDPMGSWLKCFATLALMVTLVYGRPYAADRGMLRVDDEDTECHEAHVGHRRIGHQLLHVLLHQRH